jgi:hypothetical protein
MVVRINTPKSLQETLNYNEQKVNRGVATCIAENHFPYPLSAMNFYHKLSWLEQRNELNTTATSKTIHISLNFHPVEQLTNDALISIATSYMHEIGFSNQPYLVYRHQDAGHPHIHILATTIQKNGARINTHNMGRNQSEISRKQIKQSFDLVRADSKQALPEKLLSKRFPTKLKFAMVQLKPNVGLVICYNKY